MRRFSTCSAASLSFLDSWFYRSPGPEQHQEPNHQVLNAGIEPPTPQSGQWVQLGVHVLFQMGQARLWEQEIPIEGTIRVGELLTYNLTELIKPESYLVRLTPITRFGEGDATERIITYSCAYRSVC